MEEREGLTPEVSLLETFGNRRSCAARLPYGRTGRALEQTAICHAVIVGN